MDFLSTRLSDFLQHAKNVVYIPFSPGSRIYVLYLASSVAIAFLVYLKVRTAHPQAHKSFLRFLFPAKVWSNPSAWLDVRYFFFTQFFGQFLLLGLTSIASLAAFRLVTGFAAYEDIPIATALTGWKGSVLAVGFMFISFIVSDFVSFYMHYLQHKVSFLWQFHKVHHSAEVMHPLSNFREHPMDNLVYMSMIGLSYGVVTGLSVNLIGYVPGMPTLLGLPILMFLFNIMGYNLRHSHVWLRWPGVWSKVFPSPAHHHVHHSCHPDHLDKNFAFLFPVWDVLFRTYVMPEDNRDVKFGVTEKDKGHELNSCVKLYALPIRDAWRVLFRKRNLDLAEGAARDLAPSGPKANAVTGRGGS